MQPTIRAAVIADLHDNDANLRFFLERLDVNILDELWIAGDVGLPETVASIAQNFPKTIRIVAGNNERGHKLSDYERLGLSYSHLVWQSNAPYMWDLPSGRLVLGHEPDPVRLYVEQSPVPITLAIAGHTHRPNLTMCGATPILNPGTLGGVFTPATYATVEFGDQVTYKLHRLYNQL